MRTFSSSFIFPAVLLLAATTSWANTCSRDDIDYYLERGFSHEQVVKLCSDESKTEPGSLDKGGTRHDASAPPTQATTNTSKVSPESMENEVNHMHLVYFKTTIKSDQVELTPDSLSYLLSGCIKFGEPDSIGFREEACVTTNTTIKRKGLKVIKADREILLVREPALFIAGNIKREILDIDKLKQKKRKAFLAEYQLNPKQLSIPVRSGIDPLDVAARLKLIAK